MESKKYNNLFAGHSFVSRFNRWMCETTHVIDQQCSVDFAGLGGNTITKLAGYLRWRNLRFYDMILLDIGSNDLDHSYETAESVADKLYDLVKQIRRAAPRSVILVF